MVHTYLTRKSSEFLAYISVQSGQYLLCTKSMSEKLRKLVKYHVTLGGDPVMSL